MNIPVKLALVLVSIVLACLYAALFGALHNQISYLVSPDYFHAFKFIQFGIPPDLHNRIGAALVGVLASWWMGIPLGLVVAPLAWTQSSWQKFLIDFHKMAAVMILVTILVSVLGILVGTFTATSDPVSGLPVPLVVESSDDQLKLVPGKEAKVIIIPIEATGVQSPYRFRVAGTMHNFTYAGGVLALLVGIGYQIMLRRAANRPPPAEATAAPASKPAPGKPAK
jgi:hypothetical protein